MKILIIVLSYNDNGGIYSQFNEIQKKTWDSINVENVETFYLYGNHDKNEIVNGDILTDVIETGPNCGGYKTIKSFELINNLEYDYIFRTNSSSYIDKKILNGLFSQSSTGVYAGLTSSHDNIGFVSGSGYFLSRDLVELVVKNSNLWNHNLLDDIALADLLSKFNITPTSTNHRCDVTVKNQWIPMDFYHYRFRTDYREHDIENMDYVHKLKTNYYNSL
jgi:hypothetical protein